MEGTKGDLGKDDKIIMSFVNHFICSFVTGPFRTLPVRNYGSKTISLVGT
jgi:hypothetical protein